MILASSRIKEEVKKGSIIINPFYAENLNPNSYDVRLGNHFIIIDDEAVECIEPNKKMPPEYYKEITLKDGEDLVIEPSARILAHTLETVGSHKFVPKLEGKSSLGRQFIKVHETAGMGDIGFQGQWTLEISCSFRTVLKPKIDIAQIMFYEITGEPEVPYDKSYKSRYHNQKGATPTKNPRSYE